MKVLVRTPYPISLLIRTYISRRADLYWSTQQAILVDEATYIGSPADPYSFAPSPLWVWSRPFGKQRSLPAPKYGEAYNAIARPQEPWAQEGGRYYTNLTYSIQEVNPEESDGSRLRMTSPARGEKPPQEAEERIRLGA